MLLESGRASEALDAYEGSLAQAPNRFNSLYGAAYAAELAHDDARAREGYAALLAQCVPHSPRPELEHARKFVGRS